MLLTRLTGLAVVRRRLVLVGTALFLALAGVLGGGVAGELLEDRGPARGDVRDGVSQRVPREVAVGGLDVHGPFADVDERAGPSADVDGGGTAHDDVVRSVVPRDEDVVQIRTIALQVAEQTGCPVTFAEGAGPDARNYRVSFAKINRVLPDWQLPDRTAWAVFPGRRLMPAKTRAFIDTLENALGEAAAGAPAVKPARRPRSTS